MKSDTALLVSTVERVHWTFAEGNQIYLAHLRWDIHRRKPNEGKRPPRRGSNTNPPPLFVNPVACLSLFADIQIQHIPTDIRSVTA